MAGLPPLNNAGGAATEADADELAAAKQLRTYLNICDEFVPTFPDFHNRELTALPASDDGVDRISLLPDALLRNILSRLLVTDAACTALLSSRWRRVWLSTPLSFIDAYLSLPSGNSSLEIAAVVSRILEAHSGPFRCVHLVSADMNACQAQLARWLELLAAKGVDELVLVNRPCTLTSLPATLFGVTSLTRLFIGLWKFPQVATLPRGSFFPHLRELGTCSVVMDGADVEAVIARSPVLEILSIQGSNKGLRLRLVSQSLRCVQICDFAVENIAVVRAPRLDRLIMETPPDNADGLSTRVSIGDGTNLQSLGVLKPGNHVLEIRGTIIVAGIKVSPSTMVMQVKALSLDVRFGNPGDVKMVPTFLRCFPNLERLHITSRTSEYQDGSAKHNLRFWKSAKPTQNINSCIKVMSFREFRGGICEVAFLKFFFQSARVLQSATILMADLSFTSLSRDLVFSASQEASKKMASKSCRLVVLGSDGPEGGRLWSFKRGTDYSFEDPFSPVEWLSGA